MKCVIIFLFLFSVILISCNICWAMQNDRESFISFDDPDLLQVHKFNHKIVDEKVSENGIYTAFLFKALDKEETFFIYLYYKNRLIANIDNISKLKSIYFERDHYFVIEYDCNDLLDSHSLKIFRIRPSGCTIIKTVNQIIESVFLKDTLFVRYILDNAFEEKNDRLGIIDLSRPDCEEKTFDNISYFHLPSLNRQYMFVESYYEDDIREGNKLYILKLDKSDYTVIQQLEDVVSWQLVEHDKLQRGRYVFVVCKEEPNKDQHILKCLDTKGVMIEPEIIIKDIEKDYFFDTDGTFFIFEDRGDERNKTCRLTVADASRKKIVRKINDVVGYRFYDDLFVVRQKINEEKTYRLKMFGGKGGMLNIKDVSFFTVYKNFISVSQSIREKTKGHNAEDVTLKRCIVKRFRRPIGSSRQKDFFPTLSGIRKKKHLIDLKLVFH